MLRAVAAARAAAPPAQLRARASGASQRCGWCAARRGAAAGRRGRACLVVEARERAFRAARALTLPLRAEHPAFPVERYLQVRPSRAPCDQRARLGDTPRRRVSRRGRRLTPFASKNAERVVHLSFPDSHRRQRVSGDTWRVQLLPLKARAVLPPLSHAMRRLSHALSTRFAAPQFLWLTLRVSCTLRAWPDAPGALAVAGREMHVDGLPPDLGAPLPRRRPLARRRHDA